MRRIDGLEIYFSWTAETIYIRHPGGWMLYHRWFAGRGSFRRNYYPFAKALKNNRHIDLIEINRLASRYGMTPGGVYKTPDFTGHEIRELPSIGRIRRRPGDPPKQRSADPFGNKRREQ